MRSFPSQAGTRVGKGRTDVGDEFIPTRGPLEQQLRRVMKLDDRDLFELESFGQRECVDLASG